MIILGIESSCDETAAAVVETGRTVRSNAISSQIDLHAEYGGVVPEIASRAHVERILPVIETALTDANCSLTDIHAIAVGNRPGLIGSLLVGVAAAKSLAWSLAKPVIGVNHIEAHLYAALLDDQDWTPETVFPALGLVVSGGHTAIYRVDSPLHMTRLGSTIDDAIGEAYDKAASILGLGYPGGPIVDQRAQRGDASSHTLPISRLKPGSLDFSYSGLKTALLYTVRGIPTASDEPGGKPVFGQKAEDLSETEIDDLCASFQKAAIDAVVLKMKRAIEAFGVTPRSILVGGGVSANSLLRSRITALGDELSIPVRVPKMAYCLDNAAMIAGLAHERAAANSFDDLTLGARPTGSR
ncbi:MAG: tRNA (adenosine(37)-N6)-threonylcarbamoyltransferase complex transferase subunit TsaD [Phycisphaerales bacterium JB065]